MGLLSSLFGRKQRGRRVADGSMHVDMTTASAGGGRSRDDPGPPNSPRASDTGSQRPGDGAGKQGHGDPGDGGGGSGGDGGGGGGGD